MRRFGPELLPSDVRERLTAPSSAAAVVPSTEVDRTRWVLLCLGAADEWSFLDFARSLLSRALRSSFCTLPWERAMKCGLDLCSASCQKQTDHSWSPQNL